ncbi:general stress protein [Fuchsiella alkaliacetigena]|uniref:general stress protein n=1 Tax=Fuchsiella alkaliacetigena TaxID=957042 RepID=UPI00200B3E99|nr:general stress protein [Fuchsiella alkaliacetigena]MCK8823489.1 general stress protein [Fuchsiella alkaliacetigena]
MSSVIGVFANEERAERAVNEIKQAGLDEGEISIVAKGEEGATGEEQQGQRGKTEMSFENQNLGDGTATGGAIGGIAGLMAGAGLFAIPGVGPIIAAGPIAAGLSGAVAGGLTGALVDYGIPEEASQEYENQVRQGNILAICEGLEDRDQLADIEAIMQRNGATEIEIH